MVITVHGSDHAPLANAQVNGVWSRGAGGNGSCVTDVSGRCSLIMNNIPRRVKFVQLTIEDVLASNRTYRPQENHDPDNDSDGTIIVVTR